MKLISSEESVEVLQSTGQHMSPPSLARLKTGTVVVDMDDRSEGDYDTPNKKAARVEPISRIHLIPLLMIFVFFILWAGSTEVHPDQDPTPEIFVMRMPTSNQFAASEQLKVFDDENLQHGARTVQLEHDHASHLKHAFHALSEKTYMRGITR